MFKFIILKLYSIITLSCPRCHKGKLFVSNNPYRFSRDEIMHRECPVCGQIFIPETGFYWGAMYIGYGISTGFIFALLGIDLLVEGYVSYPVLFGSVLAALVLMPVLSRIARATWINFFVHYDEDY